MKLGITQDKDSLFANYVMLNYITRFTVFSSTMFIELLCAYVRILLSNSYGNK